MKKIAVLITCYNRLEKTLDCLDLLFKCKIPDDIFLSVYLVDDASTDGTCESVRINFPMVNIIKTNGNLFWNRGMYLAFNKASEFDFDAYLWLNDDTSLYPDAISKLIDANDELFSRFSKYSILVGSTVGDNGFLSYGGSVSVSKLTPFKYKKVWSPDELVECEVMNGNCVLIPREIANKVGNLDYSFEHAMGDTDYALRARKLGFKVYVAPGYVGKCSVNAMKNTYVDRDLSLRDRWRHIKSRKGLPLKSWYIFTRRHGGVMWFLYFIWPYLKLIVK